MRLIWKAASCGLVGALFGAATGAATGLIFGLVLGDLRDAISVAALFGVCVCSPTFAVAGALLDDGPGRGQFGP